VDSALLQQAFATKPTFALSQMLQVKSLVPDGRMLRVEFFGDGT
jgi:hypothetical protein